MPIANRSKVKFLHSHREASIKEKNVDPHSHGPDDRHGARQPERFNPERASRLDDPARFEYLPPKEVARMLDIPTGGKLLDFGTGTGTYAIELARLRPDVEVIALDEQPEMLGLLQAKPAAAELTNLKPVLSAGMANYRGKIDRVLALNVLHELGDEALQTVKAMLGSGGAALFIDWNAEIERPAGPPADHIYSPTEGRRRLEQMGFKIRSKKLFLYHYSILAD
ncbi:MAG TPA: class I SAM-dependent methyltransferase [Terriglobia bacterium]|nr:class I SAM-dependent methyltransferase [Terriglobia bacterium]